jgi:hypothetical protein
VAIDERTFEALLPDPAIQFIGRLLGGCDRQGGKGCKAFWILLHDIGEEIVRLAGDRDLLRHLGLLDAGRIQREHLHVDTGGVHLSQAPFADILQLRENLRTAGAGAAESVHETAARPGNKAWAREVFFKGDGSQFHSSLRRVAHGAAIALCNRRYRHHCRSSTNRCSVDKVAPIHASPPICNACATGDRPTRCEPPSIVGTIVFPWTTLRNRRCCRSKPKFRHVGACASVDGRASSRGAHSYKPMAC